MLGTFYREQPTLVIEPLYSRDIDRQLAENLMEEAIKKMRDAIIWRGYIKFVLVREKDEDVIVAGSHNPAGHYNDIIHGESGQNGESYKLS